jgi:hypothetical protein
MRIIVPSDCWYPQLIEPQTPYKNPSSRSRLALLLSPAQGPVLLRIARARPSPFKLGQSDAGHGYKIKSKAQNQQLFSQRTPLPDARMHGVQRSFTRQQVRRRRGHALPAFSHVLGLCCSSSFRPTLSCSLCGRRRSTSQSKRLLRGTCVQRNAPAKLRPSIALQRCLQPAPLETCGSVSARSTRGAVPSHRLMLALLRCCAG